MSNGEPLVVRGALKPISTLTKPLRSVDTETKEPAQALRERTDSTVVPAAGVVGEAMVALVLAALLPGEVRRRPHRRRAARLRRLPGAHRVAALSHQDRALVFIGFMGAGKSRAAPRLRAARASRPSTRTRSSSASSATPIAEFFDRDGEAEFRRREAEVVPRLLDARPRRRHRARRRRRHAPSASATRSPTTSSSGFEVDAETAWERAARHDRPLARDRDAFEALHAEREPLYRELADATLRRAGDDVAVRALPHLLALRELPGRHAVALGRRAARASTRRSSALAFSATLRAGGCARPRAFVVADATVATLYGAGALEGAEAVVRVPPGEGSKTLARGRARARRARPCRDAPRRPRRRARRRRGRRPRRVLRRRLPARRCRRPGADHARRPRSTPPTAARPAWTSPRRKNYVGAFHQPAAVIADTETLATLPEAELAAGFVEVLKTGLIAGGRAVGAGARRRARSTSTRSHRSIAAVREREARGRRRRRARGRRGARCSTSATRSATRSRPRAATSATATARPSGLGLLAALRLSEADGPARGGARRSSARHGLPIELDPAIDDRRHPRGLERDKKRTADGVGFVLLRAPGRGRASVSAWIAARVRAAVEELR